MSKIDKSKDIFFCILSKMSTLIEYRVCFPDVLTKNIHTFKNKLVEVCANVSLDTKQFV